MGSIERTEVYWKHGRLVPVKNLRPSGLGRWAQLSGFDHRDLVASIEGKAGNVSIVGGPQMTEARLADSVLLHLGRAPSKTDRGVWQDLPREVSDGVLEVANNASTRIAEQWFRFSNEEAMTGALFSRVAQQYQFGTWSAQVEFVEFSKITKEPEVGADVAVVMDAVAADGRRAFKTIWFQAKRTASIPSDLGTLTDFQDQLAKMQQHTDHAYGLLFTTRGAFVARPGFAAVPFGQFVAATMQCHHGDEFAKIFAQSMNRKQTLRMWLRQTAP